MDKNNSSGVKGLADMDARLRKLNKRLGEMEDAIRKLEKVCVKFLRKHNLSKIVCDYIFLNIFKTNFVHVGFLNFLFK